jgi:hypothetical protein
MMIRVALLFTVALACSGTNTNVQDPVPGGDPPPGLLVAGNYPTAVSMVEDSCGGSVVQSMPTVVTHALDATTLSLTHAGSRYDGTIARDGTFQTVAGTPLVLSGFSYIVTVGGKFSVTGFNATALVDRTTVGVAGSRCRYVVKWVGTRTSGTNVILGT